MSKIEEMAEKYSNDIESNYNIDMFDRGDIFDAFKSGANAVLGEIDKAYNMYSDSGATCAMIKKVLNELKGKE